jgi:hypothetical protein
MRSIKPLPDRSQLEEWFAIKGSDLVWRVNYFPDLVGKRAGHLRQDGYITINKCGQKMLAHRVAYCLHYGQDPGNYFVDHIDGNPSNNDPSNLRLATHTENMRNVRRLRTNNKSGKHGVRFVTVNGVQYWKAEIFVASRAMHLGSYGTKEEAIAARQVAERFVYGDFAPICPDLSKVFSLFSSDANADQTHPE